MATQSNAFLCLTKLMKNSLDQCLGAGVLRRSHFTALNYVIRRYHLTVINAAAV